MRCLRCGREERLRVKGVTVQVTQGIESRVYRLMRMDVVKRVVLVRVGRGGWFPCMGYLLG
jgi:hypothetical protein